MDEFRSICTILYSDMPVDDLVPSLYCLPDKLRTTFYHNASVDDLQSMGLVQCWKECVPPVVKRVSELKVGGNAPAASAARECLAACARTCGLILPCLPKEAIACLSCCTDASNQVYSDEEPGDGDKKDGGNEGAAPSGSSTDDTTWRKALGFQGLVDVVTTAQGKQAWKTGTIMLEDGDHLTVFFEDGTPEQVVERFASTLQRPGTMLGKPVDTAPGPGAQGASSSSSGAAGGAQAVADFRAKRAWTYSLRPGDVIDVEDKERRWSSATVVRVGEMPGYYVSGITVGFRVYCTAGRSTDRKGRRYDGLGEEWDEAISLEDRNLGRLDKPGARTRGLPYCLLPPGIDAGIDDANDPIIRLEGPPRDAASAAAAAPASAASSSSDAPGPTTAPMPAPVPMAGAGAGDDKSDDGVLDEHAEEQPIQPPPTTHAHGLAKQAPFGAQPGSAAPHGLGPAPASSASSSAAAASTGPAPLSNLTTEQVQAASAGDAKSIQAVLDVIRAALVPRPGVASASANAGYGAAESGPESMGQYPVPTAPAVPQHQAPMEGYSSPYGAAQMNPYGAAQGQPVHGGAASIAGAGSAGPGAGGAGAGAGGAPGPIEAVPTADTLVIHRRGLSSNEVLPSLRSFAESGGLSVLLAGLLSFVSPGDAVASLRKSGRAPDLADLPVFLDALRLLGRVWPHLNRHAVAAVGAVLSAVAEGCSRSLGVEKVLRSFYPEHAMALDETLPPVLWRHCGRQEVRELTRSAQWSLVCSALSGPLFPPKPLAIRAMGQMVSQYLSGELREPQSFNYGRRTMPHPLRFAVQPWLTPTRLRQLMEEHGVLDRIFGRGGTPQWFGEAISRLDKWAQDYVRPVRMEPGEEGAGGDEQTEGKQVWQLCEPALVEVSEPLLKAMAQHGQFQGPVVLSVLGPILRGEKRTSVATVCELLQSGASWIEEPPMSVMSRVFLQLRDDRVRTEVVECVFRLARKGGGHKRPFKNYPYASLYMLDTLYGWNSEETACSREAKDLAGEHLVELLRSSNFYRFCKLFYAKALLQPLESKGLTTGLRLASRIANVIKETGGGYQYGLGYNVVRRDDILSYVLNGTIKGSRKTNLERIGSYWQSWKQQQAVALRDVPWKDRADHVVGLYTYMQHVQGLLEFLGDGLRQSTKRTVLTRDLALLLFDTGIRGALCEEEHQAFATWMVRLLRDHRSGSCTAIDVDVPEAVLEQRLLKGHGWILKAVTSARTAEPTPPEAGSAGPGSGSAAGVPGGQAGSGPGVATTGHTEPGGVSGAPYDAAGGAASGVDALSKSGAGAPPPLSGGSDQVSLADATMADFRLLQEFTGAYCTAQGIVDHIYDSSLLAHYLQGGSEIDVIPRSPPDFIGSLASLWQIATSGKDDRVARDAQILVAEFYGRCLTAWGGTGAVPVAPITQEFLDKCKKSLSDSLQGSGARDAGLIRQRTLQLVLRTISASHAESVRRSEISGGTGCLRSHAQVLPGQLAPITVDASSVPGNGPDGRPIPAKLVLPMRSNSSLADLKRCAAWALRLRPERIELCVKALDDSRHHSTDGLEFGTREADGIDHTSSWLRARSKHPIPEWAGSLLLNEVGMARQSGVEVVASVKRAGKSPLIAGAGGAAAGASQRQVAPLVVDGDMSPRLLAVEKCIFDCFASYVVPGGEVKSEGDDKSSSSSAAAAAASQEDSSSSDARHLPGAIQALTKRDVARLFTAWGSKTYTSANSDVMKTVNVHSTSGGQFLTRSDFHGFLATRAMDKEGATLRTELKKLGWRKDLVRDGDLLEDKVGVPEEILEMARANQGEVDRLAIASAWVQKAAKDEQRNSGGLMATSIIKQTEWMQLLFHIASTDSSQSAQIAWTVLRSLPVHPGLVSQLRGFVYQDRGQADMQQHAERSLAQLLGGEGWLLPEGHGQVSAQYDKMVRCYSTIALLGLIRAHVDDKWEPSAPPELAKLSSTGSYRGRSQSSSIGTGRGQVPMQDQDVGSTPDDPVLPFPGPAVLAEYDASLMDGQVSVAKNLTTAERAMLFYNLASTTIVQQAAKALGVRSTAGSQTAEANSFQSAFNDHFASVNCNLLRFLLLSDSQALGRLGRARGMSSPIGRYRSHEAAAFGAPVGSAQHEAASGAGAGAGSGIGYGTPVRLASQDSTRAIGALGHGGSIVRQCMPDKNIGPMLELLSNEAAHAVLATKVGAAADKACSALSLEDLAKDVITLAVTVIHQQLTLDGATLVEALVSVWYAAASASPSVVPQALADDRKQVLMQLLEFDGPHGPRIRRAWAAALLKATRVLTSEPTGGSGPAGATVDCKHALLVELLPKSAEDLRKTSPEQSALICRLVEDISQGGLASGALDGTLLRDKCTTLLQALFTMEVVEVEPPSPKDASFEAAQSIGVAALSAVEAEEATLVSARPVEDTAPEYMRDDGDATPVAVQRAKDLLLSSSSSSSQALSGGATAEDAILFEAANQMDSCSAAASAVLPESSLDDERVISVLQLLTTLGTCFPTSMQEAVRAVEEGAGACLSTRPWTSEGLDATQKHCLEHYQEAQIPGCRLAVAIMELCVLPRLPDDTPSSGFGIVEISPDTHPMPLCKRPRSRQAAFNAIRSLLSKYPLAAPCVLQSCIKPRLDSLRKPDDVQFDPSRRAKASSGAIGLKNFGNTCYMNSTLQQLFYIEPLRNVLLTVGDAKPVAAATEQPYPGSSGSMRLPRDPRAIRVLSSVQELFTALLSSDRQDFEPHSLIWSYTEMGYPVDVKQQKDAHGFLSGLLDTLSEGLTDASAALSSGASESKSAEGEGDGVDAARDIHSICYCEYDTKKTYKEHPEVKSKWSRDETCLVGVEVRGMDSVGQGLSKMLEPQAIEDYRAPDLGGEVVTMETHQTIRKLPPFLFLQLQRMTFDYRVGDTVKLNHKVEFPLELNMEEYTTEGQLWRQAQQASQPKEQGGSPSEAGAGDGVVSSGDAAGGGAARGASGPVDASPDDAPPTGGQSEEAAPVDLPPHFSELPTGPYQVQPKSYYEYELYGIVIHRGTAQSGHYYSFIRDKNGKDEHSWLRMDDSTVAAVQLPPDALEQEAFGGAGGGGPVDPELAALGFNSQNEANAYLLVYRRKDDAVAPSDVPAAVAEVAAAAESTGTGESKHDDDKVAPSGPPPPYSACGDAAAAASLRKAQPALMRQSSTRSKLLACPESARSLTATANSRFLLDRLVFQHDFLALFADLAAVACSQQKLGLALSPFNTVLRATIEVVARAKSAETLPLLRAALTSGASAAPGGALAAISGLTNLQDSVSKAVAAGSAPSEPLRIQFSRTGSALQQGLYDAERVMVRMELGALLAELFARAAGGVAGKKFIRAMSVLKPGEHGMVLAPREGMGWWQAPEGKQLRYPEQPSVPYDQLARALEFDAEALPLLAASSLVIGELLPLCLKKWFKFDEAMRAVASMAAASQAFRACLLWSGTVALLADVALQTRSPLQGAVDPNTVQDKPRKHVGNSAVSPRLGGMLAAVFAVGSHVSLRQPDQAAVPPQDQGALDPATPVRAVLSSSCVYPGGVPIDAPGFSVGYSHDAMGSVASVSDACINEGNGKPEGAKGGDTDKHAITGTMLVPVPLETVHGGSAAASKADASSHTTPMQCDLAVRTLLTSPALVAEAVRSGHAFYTAALHAERLATCAPASLPGLVSEAVEGLNSGGADVRLRAWVLAGVLVRAVNTIDDLKAPLRAYPPPEPPVMQQDTGAAEGQSGAAAGSAPVSSAPEKYQSGGILSIFGWGAQGAEPVPAPASSTAPIAQAGTGQPAAGNHDGYKDWDEPVGDSDEEEAGEDMSKAKAVQIYPPSLPMSTGTSVSGEDRGQEHEHDSEWTELPVRSYDRNSKWNQGKQATALHLWLMCSLLGGRKVAVPLPPAAAEPDTVPFNTIPVEDGGLPGILGAIFSRRKVAKAAPRVVTELLLAYVQLAKHSPVATRSVLRCVQGTVPPDFKGRQDRWLDFTRKTVAMLSNFTQDLTRPAELHEVHVLQRELDRLSGRIYGTLPPKVSTYKTEKTLFQMFADNSNKAIAIRVKLIEDPMSDKGAEVYWIVMSKHRNPVQFEFWFEDDTHFAYPEEALNYRLTKERIVKTVNPDEVKVMYRSPVLDPEKECQVEDDKWSYYWKAFAPQYGYRY